MNHFSTKVLKLNKTLQKHNYNLRKINISKRIYLFFFLKYPAPPEIYPLPLHDALPIYRPRRLLVRGVEILELLLDRRARLALALGVAPRVRGGEGLEPLGRSAPAARRARAGLSMGIGRAHV